MKAKNITDEIKEAIGGTFGRMARTFKTGFEKDPHVGGYGELTQNILGKFDHGDDDYDIRTRRAGFGRDLEAILAMKYTGSASPSSGNDGEGAPNYSDLTPLQKTIEKFNWKMMAPEKIAQFVSMKIARDNDMGERTLVALWAILADFNDLNRKVGNRAQEILKIEKAIQYVADKIGVDLNDTTQVRGLEKQAKYFNIRKGVI